MAGRTRKGRSRKTGATGEDLRADVDDGSDELPDEAVTPAAGAGIPRWRQIEIMHERAQLRKMLDDLDMDFDELEMEVFGTEAEHEAFYRHLGEAEEEEVEFEDEEDDEFEDEDYEDAEDPA